MKTAAFSWSSMANYLTTSSGAKNSLGKAIASARIAIRKSFRTFGKIITKGCGSGCADNLPSPCGTSGSDNSISDAIGSASRRFFGAGRATGCSLPPRSKACSLQEWFRRGPTARDSITFSPSLRCRDRGPVLKAFNFCRRALSAHYTRKFGQESGHC